MKLIEVTGCLDCPQPSQTRSGYCARAKAEIPGGILGPMPKFCPLKDDTESSMQEHVDDLTSANQELLDELSQKNDLLYQMARLLRNTDAIHPSTAGPEAGRLLLELRLLDGSEYAVRVM
jgi:hypothetical protein